MTGDGRVELREAVRAFLDVHSSSAAVRAAMDSEIGYDPAVWKRMANELGLHGIGTREELGGSGGTIEDLAVVFEELGRALTCGPFFATVALAIPAVLASGDDGAIAELLPGLLDGTHIGTVILNDALGPWSVGAVTLSAIRTDAGYEINGSATMVLAGDVADVLLVAVRTESGISLFSVDGSAHGLTRQRSAALDRTRSIASLEFDSVAATLVGQDGQADAGLARTFQLALVALAAEQVGGAQRCLDMAVDYATQRVQFGRPIGSFQAVKHRCADMLVAVESARSAAMHAAEVAASSAPGSDYALAIATSVAKAYCSKAFVDAALDMMRIHGGVGFTWEHDAHLYVRRAKSDALMFGSPAVHTERLADLVG